MPFESSRAPAADVAAAVSDALLKCSLLADDDALVRFMLLLTQLELLLLLLPMLAPARNAPAICFKLLR